MERVVEVLFVGDDDTDELVFAQAPGALDHRARRARARQPGALLRAPPVGRGALARASGARPRARRWSGPSAAPRAPERVHAPRAASQCGSARAQFGKLLAVRGSVTRARPRANRTVCLHAIRLHHAPGRQGRAAQARDPQEHLAVVLPRRQDRRARPQRLRQVDAAQDHGRRGQELRGRGGRHAGSQDRLPQAGARARSGEDRARGGRVGPRRGHAGQGRAREGLRRLRRARCRLRQARGRPGKVRGDHRRERRGHRAPARDRRRRAEPAAVGREDRHAVRRRETARRAVQAAAVEDPTCCCSTNRPTTSTPRASTGSSSS